jgi:hypothetical protein
VVDSVAATATHTDDLDDAVLFWEVFEIETFRLVGISVAWHICCFLMLSVWEMG